MDLLSIGAAPVSSTAVPLLASGGGLSPISFFATSSLFFLSISVTEEEETSPPLEASALVLEALEAESALTAVSEDSSAACLLSEPCPPCCRWEEGFDIKRYR